MTEMYLVEIVKTVGLPVGLLIVLILWLRGYLEKQNKRSEEREDRMSVRMNDLEDFQRTQLVELSTKATLAMSDMGHGFREMVGLLSRRKCLLDESLNDKKIAK
jgi:hypothetical protein